MHASPAHLHDTGSTKRRRGWLLALAMAVPVLVQLALYGLLPLLPQQHGKAWGYAAAAFAALLMCALAVRFEVTRASSSKA